MRNDPVIAAAIETFHLRTAPVTLPVFEDVRTSYWARYDAIEADGVRNIEVEIEMMGHRIGPTPYLDIDAHFDPGKFCCETYGLVYGDDVFEKAISALARDIFRLPPDFPDLHYTEAGMQTHSHISLEGGKDWISALASLSQHRALTLKNDPRIRSMSR